MHAFLETVASNSLVVAVLAVGVALLGRIWKNPAGLHLLWILVLLKLVTPPLVTVPLVLPMSERLVASGQHGTNHDVTPQSPATHPRRATASAATTGFDERASDDRAPAGSPTAATDAASSVSLRNVTPWLTILLWTWAAGIALSASGRTCRVLRFRRLLRAAEAPPSALLRMAEEISRRLGLRRVPRIAMLRVRVSPLVWSVGARPRVILPSALFERLGAEARQAILAHELAHVRRKDHWVRLLELVVATLFWWHPVVWWACRQVRELEEQCCDGLVLGTVSHAAKAYATALVDTLDFLSERPVTVPLIATGANSPVSLERRIKMLSNRAAIKPLTVGRLVLLAAVAAVPMVVAFAAETPETDNHPPAAVQPTAVDPEVQQSATHLRDIMSAMHMYHDAAGHFPVAQYGWGYDRKAEKWFRQRPYLSWRVLLLPFLGEKDLFAKFHMDEPWDSENNRKLIPLVPEIYRTPGSKAGQGKTNYLGVVGPKAAFPDKGTIMVEDFTDGTSGTIMLVEAPNKAAVEWTRPEDFSINTKDPVKKLVGLRKGGFLSAFADGSPQFISDNIPSETLRRLLTRDAGDLVHRRDLQRWMRFVPPVAATAAEAKNTLGKVINRSGKPEEGAEIDDRSRRRGRSTGRGARIASGEPLGVSIEKADLMGRIEWAMMHGRRDITARKSIEWGEVRKNEKGNRTIRYKYYATIWDKDVYIVNEVFTFDAKGNILDVKNVKGFPQKKVEKPVNVNTQEGMKELVERFFSRNFRDITSRESLEWGKVVKAANGNSSIRYKYRARIWDKETKIMNQVFTFDPKGKFVSVRNVEGFPQNP